MLGHDTGELITEIDDIADLRLLPRFDQRFPVIGIQTAQEEDLHLAARLIAMADQARRHHARIIENQCISRLNILLQVIEMIVADRLLHRIEHHEPRCIPRLDRRLCNALFRKFIIKIG